LIKTRVREGYKKTIPIRIYFSEREMDLIDQFVEIYDCGSRLELIRKASTGVINLDVTKLDKK
jgi:hypothetical protein